MKIQLVLLKGLFLLLLALQACAGSAALKDTRALAGATPIPQSPGYLRGVLDNGLRYSIRANDKVADRMRLSLVINAGSLQEEDDQRGLAHFVEHLAFNGSEHFPGNELIEFAYQNGMDFGAHVNAYTSFEETVYRFSLPTDQPELLDKGLLVLYDWLSGLAIEPQEVENERGVVLTEWRGALGFTERFRDTWLPFVLGGSQYEHRLPIGEEEVIQNAPPQRLRDFYQQWYNAGNAMIVVVGDFDAAQMQQRIETVFAAIAPRGQKQKSGAERQWEPVLLRSAPTDEQGKVLWPADVRAKVMQDDEAPTRQIAIHLKTRREPVATTVGELRRSLVLNLLQIITYKRFSDLSKNHSQTVVGMGGLSAQSFGDVTFESFYVQSQQGKLQQAYKLLLESMAQLRQYGVQQGELNLAMRYLRSQVKQRYNERDKQENAQWSRAEIEQFLGADYNADIAWVYENLERILAPIDLAQLNRRLDEILSSTDVAIMALGADPAELPAEEQLVTAYRQLEQIEVADVAEEVAVPLALLEEKPQAGKIVARTQLQRSGYTKWQLDNGIQVYFKSTEFEQDSIEFDAFRRGGAFGLGDDFGPGSVIRTLLNSVVSRSGLGGLSPEQFERYALPLKAYSNWGFRLYSSHLHGGSDTADLEQLFQQIYLAFTQPQFSQKLVDQGLRTLKTDYADMMAHPESRFNYLVRQNRYRDDYRVIQPPPEKIPAYSTDQVQAAFDQLVPSAKDFTFVFVGNIPKGVFASYVRHYLASLPTAEGFAEGEEDPLPLYEQGGQEEFAIAPEGKANTLILWDKYIQPQRFADQPNLRMKLLVKVLSNLLDIRMVRQLREEMGKTYSPYASIHFTAIPQNRMTTVFGYTSAPEDVAPLEAALDKIIADVQDGNITGSDFANSIEQVEKSYEAASQSNSFWLGELASALMKGYDNLDEILSKENFTQRIAGIRPQDLQDFARRYWPKQRRIRYTMLPQPIGGKTDSTEQP